MRLRWMSVAALVMTLWASRANAQGVGVRAGVSGDPNQFYMGAHVKTDELADHLRFRPNLEVGISDSITLAALNFEFAYAMQQKKRTDWSLYVGAGPAATPESAASATSVPGALRAAGAFRDVTIPEGTALPLVLDVAVSSATSRIDDAVRAHLARAIVVNGLTAIPQGSQVAGTVTSAERSTKVKGRAHIAIRFDNVRPAGLAEEYSIRTAVIARTAPGTMKKDALRVALPATGGAVLGGDAAWWTDTSSSTTRARKSSSTSSACSGCGNLPIDWSTRC